MDDLILKAFEAQKKGQSYAFATVVESTTKGTPRKAGAKMVVLEDGTIFGSIGGGRNEKNAQLECLKAIKLRKPTLATYKFDEKPGNSICGGQIKVFIEPFAGKRHFIICGAGHIAQPLSLLAKMLNFKVTVIDNRPEFGNKTRFPHVDEILLGEHEKTLKKLKITPETFIMLVTHGYEHDFKCLQVVLRSKAAYIGIIASKVKRVKFFRKLKSLGVSHELLKRIYAPAGLDLGAETPEEIAISIMSEVLAQIKNTLSGSLKFEADRTP